MHKSIKKSYNIFIGFVAVIVFTVTILFLVIRIPEVQTFIVRKIAGYISAEIKSTVSIDKVKFSLFNRIELEGVMIKDHYNDTLIYAPEINVAIRQLDRRNGIIKLGKVEIIKPVVAFITDSTGVMNLTRYLDLIQPSGDTVSSGSSWFHINQIDISDARFSLINKNEPPSGTPLDFNSIRLSGINAIVEDLDVRNDSTSLNIYNLSFIEAGGFKVTRFATDLVLEHNNIVFSDLSLLMDSTTIIADRIGFLADSANSFGNFTNKVRLDISLEKSLFSSGDLKYFLPFLKDFHESFWLSGKLNGTISELKGRNINLTYKNETSLDCNFDFSGLPDINNTFIFIDVNDFRSISKDIEQINLPGKGYILLPEVLRKLGVVSFSGSFTGFTTDFVTYGKINTNKGVISTDVSLRPNSSGGYKVRGLIRGAGIDLGSITERPELFGRLSMAANIDGDASSFEKFAVNLTGRVDSVEINNYKYRNIILNGMFTDQAWDGNIKIEDENIHMDLLGMFDFDRKLPEFNFTMNLLKANLNKLNIDKADTSSSLTMLLTANFNGNTFDNLDGEIKILNSTFRKYNNNLDIYDFTIKKFNRDDQPVISIRTDFLDANLTGRYNFTDIGNVVRKKLALLMPSRFQGLNSITKINDNNFVFDIKFKNTIALNKFLRTDITLSENSTIHGVFSDDGTMSVSGTAGYFSINNYIFNDLNIEAASPDSISKITVKCSAINLSGISELKDMVLELSSTPDHFQFLTNWDNKDKILNKGSFRAEGQFLKSSPDQKEPKLRIGLLPTDIYVRNNLWKIYPSSIEIDTNAISVENFNIRSNDNYIAIDGAISPDPADTINLEFNGININPLNNLYDKSMGYDPGVIPLALGGTLNGRISFTSVYRNFMFESDLKLKDFTLLGSKYGVVNIISVWNNAKKVADISSFNNLEGKKMFDIEGFYNPRTGVADLTAIADKLPIDLLNSLLSVFASGISGTASGKIKLGGELSNPVLKGALFAENATMRIDYLQTRYVINDTIRFDEEGIKLNNIRAKDDKGNIIGVNGTIYHKYFKDFSVDLDIRTNDAMVLNTRPKDNSIFYGTAYASGLTTIKSSGSVLSFDISAKTGKNTKFFIPLNNSLSVSDKSFIRFVDNKKDKKETGVALKSPPVSNSQSGFDINFDLEVTPDAEVQIIFDSKAGDVMKGTGSGNLNINLDRKGDFKMYGDYTIEDGDYLYTLGGILNKRFSVQEGGKISFNGDVENADIDIKAIYKTKASLYDIMPGMLPEAKLKERIPVECQMNLTGNLFNPVIGFDIYLPTADEQTRAYLKSMIKSDEDMSRQFLFLLVMNNFYADPLMTTNTLSTADMSSATVGVTTTEMLSNQLSNWLSQISNDFDIGVNYRPGSSAMPNSQEVQVALSTQILNDKVVINGNFDYGNNQNSTGTPGTYAITGAFDVEFKITEKIRFKVFNRSNDNFYIENGVQYTQGVGLFYRQDFTKFSDLFKKSEKKPAKKEVETKITDK